MIDLLIDSTAMLATSTAIESTPDASMWWRFFGRLHPMVLHFPIAMLIAAACVELALSWRREARPSVIASFCLWVGMAFACLAAWSGWTMAEMEGIAGNPVKAELLGWHRWTGVIVAGLSIALCLVWLIERVSHRRWAFHSYRFGLWAAAILICFVGNFGAEMKWGRNYLFSVLETPAAVETSASDEEAGSASSESSTSSSDAVVNATVFWTTDIEPIFTEHCSKCHGPTKQKSDLQLVPYAALQASRALLDTEHPTASILIHRISLPSTDPDAMPPEGPQLSSAQIETITHWIGEGAAGPIDGVRSETDGLPSSSPSAVTSPTNPASPSPFDQARQHLAIETIRAMGGHASPVNEGSPWIDVNLSLVKPRVTDEQIEVLLGLKETLFWLNLGNTAVTDAGIGKVVSQLTTLHRLKLDRTRVGDGGVARLVTLQALESLNLFSTQVTDTAIVDIEQLSSLKTVFLWDSKVTAAGFAALEQARPDLEVVGGPDPPVEAESQVKPEPPVEAKADPPAEGE